MKITDTAKLKTSELLQLCKDKFPVYSWYDDKQLDADFPIPKKATTRYFRDRVEADEEHKNKSANDLEKEGIQGITLRERIIMELQYFTETRKHLDIENWTLCSGSRRSDGHVPGARWIGEGFRVDWSNAGGSSERLRSREAIPSTLPTSSLALPNILEINGVKYKKV